MNRFIPRGNPAAVAALKWHREQCEGGKAVGPVNPTYSVECVPPCYRPRGDLSAKSSQ